MNRRDAVDPGTGSTRAGDAVNARAPGSVSGRPRGREGGKGIKWNAVSKESTSLLANQRRRAAVMLANPVVALPESGEADGRSSRWRLRTGHRRNSNSTAPLALIGARRV